MGSRHKIVAPLLVALPLHFTVTVFICSSVDLCPGPIQQLSRDFSINLSDQRKLGKSPKTKIIR